MIEAAWTNIQPLIADELLPSEVILCPERNREGDC